MSGPPPITLVLLPGMDGTGLLFTPFVRALPEWVQPVVVSYPGDRPLDYNGHLEIVMAALPTDGPFVLLGESFSGPLALMAAARQPPGLRGVILSATFIRWPLALPICVAELMVSFGVFRLKSTRLFIRIVSGKNVSAELRGLFHQVLARLTPAVLAARARAAMAVNCTDELRACPVPVLALVADRDRIIAGRCPEQIRCIRPDATFARINSPHLILQCATRDALQVITKYLDTLQPKG